MVSNLCEGGLNKQQSAKQHNCPLLPPKGLQISIKGQMLAVAPGDDITFVVHQEQVGQKLFPFQFFYFTSIQLESAESTFPPGRVTPAALSTR